MEWNEVRWQPKRDKVMRRYAWYESPMILSFSLNCAPANRLNVKSSHGCRNGNPTILRQDARASLHSEIDEDEKLRRRGPSFFKTFRLSDSSVLFHHCTFTPWHSDDDASADLRKMSPSLHAKHSQGFAGAWTHTSNGATRSNNLDFENATKVGPNRNISFSASICSLSRQHYLPFQFLGPSRAITVHNDNACAIRCFSGRRNPVWKGQDASVGWRRFFQAEFICECENVSDSDMINENKWTMFASVSKLSLSIRE
jgi:hypothetical protein